MPAETIYGPQYVEIDAMFDRAASIKTDEGKAMVETRGFRVAELFGPTGAWPTLFSAAEQAGCEEQVETAVNDVIGALDERVLDAVTDLDGAVAEAVAGVAGRHLIGQFEFTQDHYDLLVLPWSTVIGAP